MNNDTDFFKILLEIFKTKQDVNWQNDNGLLYTTFILDNQEYGITIREDEIENIPFYEVSFSINYPESKSLAATNFNKNQFKILGIVSNAVKEKIIDAKIVYFTTKLYTSHNETEYNSRIKLYSRIAHKIAIELNMYETVVSLGDETVFIIAKTSSLLTLAKEFV